MQISRSKKGTLTPLRWANLPQSARVAARLGPMTVLESAAIGCFLGFVFGVGCALAVMYSIYMGGYRAAVKDSQTEPPPERLTRALAKLR
jgi:hypothetical protein